MADPSLHSSNEYWNSKDWDPAHWDLLSVLVSPREQSQAAWEVWRSRYSVADSTALTQRQFSRVYSILKRHGSDEDSIAVLEPYFSENQRRVENFFSTLQPFFQTLNKASTPFIILKSFSFVVLGYEPLGSRRVFDIDFLVPYHEVDSIFDRLAADGWDRLIPGEDKLAIKRFRHAQDLKHANGARTDLHWYLLKESLTEEADRAFWDRSRVLLYGGCEVRLLETTDLLFHICIHGAQKMRYRYDWAIDAMLLLERESEQVDWSRLLEEARSRRLVWQLQRSVGFLRHVGCSLLPSEFLDRLSRSKLSFPDRLESFTDRRGFDTVLGGFPLKLAAFLRMPKQAHEHGRIFGYLRFLQHEWMLGNLGSTLRMILRALVRIQGRWLRSVCRSK